jgi:SAM-dependent methyltransferase
MITADDHARRAYDALAVAYDVLTAHHRYDEWTATLEQFAKAGGLRGRRLLDVACGTGKSFLPFLDRGYDVTACDISPAMVAQAVVKAAGRARVEVQDMRSLRCLGSFDFVCCIDDAVNYVHSQEELVATFAGFRRNLAPDGVVLFDTNALQSYRGFFASLSVVPDARAVVVWNGETPSDVEVGGFGEATVEILRAGDGDAWSRTLSHHRQRHHPVPAVLAALEEAQLRCVSVHGMRLDGSTTDEFDELRNSKAVYVAKRADA